MSEALSPLHFHYAELPAHPSNNPRSTHELLLTKNHPRLKPIPTKYDGYHFRSRTEAKYAVLWNTCYLPYEFERQGFALERSAYLADFYLPNQGVWIEVKDCRQR